MAKNTPEYSRHYRATVKPLNERQAHQDGVREGIEMCCKYLREIIGQRHYNGVQAALLLNKAMLGADLPEVVERRKLISTLVPRGTA